MTTGTGSPMPTGLARGGSAARAGRAKHHASASAATTSSALGPVMRESARRPLFKLEPPPEVDAYVADRRGRYVIDVVVGALDAQALVQTPLQVRPDLAVGVVREAARDAGADVVGEALAHGDLRLAPPGVRVVA